LRATWFVAVDGRGEKEGNEATVGGDSAGPEKKERKRQNRNSRKGLRRDQTETQFLWRGHETTLPLYIPSPH